MTTRQSIEYGRGAREKARCRSAQSLRPAGRRSIGSPLPCAVLVRTTACLLALCGLASCAPSPHTDSLTQHVQLSEPGRGTPAPSTDSHTLSAQNENSAKNDNDRSCQFVKQSKPSVYTVKNGEAGFYAIRDSHVQVNRGEEQRLDIRVDVRDAGTATTRQPAVLTSLAAGESFEFDVFLGYLDAGDTVQVTLTRNGVPASDSATTEYTIARTPAIPVTAFPADTRHPQSLEAPAEWSLMSSVPAGSAAARIIAWGDPDGAAGKLFSLGESTARMRLGAGAADREAIAAFRVPHSGYYALHDSWAAMLDGTNGSAEARIYVDHAARKTIRIPAVNRISLNAALGYMRKGDVVYVAFSARNETAVEFAISVVEWAPRRAPLRVRRGADGYLSVYEPAAPRRAVMIPAEKWVTVPVPQGDATEAIRKAIGQAKSLQQGDYAGLRLEAGKRYLIGTGQVGGVIFDIRDTSKFVFDGNGATLAVHSPESQRQGIKLFETSASRGIVFADMVVESITPPPYTLGEVVDVGPTKNGNQTVTFRLSPGMSDPLADIARSGMASGYAYDAEVPGRVQNNAWGFYPGAANVHPQLRAGKEPGLFEHTVTRTNETIRPGAKWLIKNKKAGVWYLTTRAGSEDITLSGVDAHACGGGLLRFWDTSGANILNCRYEPVGANWIGSSSDGVHGRGREGVWIEDTTLRGICEDIMNTYGVSMVVVADDTADDAAVSLRLYDRERGATAIPGGNCLRVGDQVVFFNPSRGQVVGYATVLNAAQGRFTLSRPISGIDAWSPDKGRGCTMVYNTRLAARFVVRDSSFMDSLRFGAFIKAREGVIFNTRFEGLADAAIYAANEPEWPEGPPPSYLWLQGNSFSHNNRSYASRYRKHVAVDPANISIYTRRLKNPDEADTFRASLAHGQHANSNMKIIGNVFHDWMGMGIAVRNCRNLEISDNLFLPPAEDAALRSVLGQDAAMTRDGRGRYAGVFLDDVVGARITGNHFYGLPEGDLMVARDQGVLNVVESDNHSSPRALTSPISSLSFAEWSGNTSRRSSSNGLASDDVDVHGCARQVGSLGAGLFFDGKKDIAVLKPPASTNSPPFSRLSVGVWARPVGSGKGAQVIYAQGDATQGAIIAVENRRFVIGVWQRSQGAWLDLGPAVPDLWHQVLLVYNGEAGTLRGYVDGIESASTTKDVPATLEPMTGTASFGGLREAARMSGGRILDAESSFYQGGVDEFRMFTRTIDASEVGVLAMRQRPYERSGPEK